MFSISFGEMGVILLVALLVVGPQRLPGMARFLGHLVGKFNRQAAVIRREIRREMEAEDLRQAAKEAEAAAKEVTDSITDATRAARETAAIPDRPAKPPPPAGG